MELSWDKADDLTESKIRQYRLQHFANDFEFATSAKIFLLIIIIIFIKKVGSARLWESDAHPISSNTPAPQYQPIDRKKEMGKIVVDDSKDRAA